MATTDPKELPEKRTWYLGTNLPHPNSDLAAQSDLAPASVAEVVRLYGLRMWVQQSYKQVKHVLGWSDYQVRSDTAIRRHWQLVCCAFAFCWWAYARLPNEEIAQRDDDPPAESAGRGKKEAPAGMLLLAGDIEGSKGLAGALCHAQKILESVLGDAPTAGTKSAA